MPTFLGSKVSVLLANILKLTTAGVSDLHIAGQVLFAICLGELVESLISNIRDIKFVVSNSQQVVIQLLKDWV
jgi:hypothetical protein